MSLKSSFKNLQKSKIQEFVRNYHVYLDDDLLCVTWEVSKYRGWPSVNSGMQSKSFTATGSICVYLEKYLSYRFETLQTYLTIFAEQDKQIMNVMYCVPIRRT